jgi:UTP--glucose-1-phosphate uridylyltransferase
MNVRKAVITAAGARQRRLPLQTLVDRDGANRSVLSMLVNEILNANVEEICVVVASGDPRVFAESVPEHRGCLTFIEQNEPRGYGDALWRARDFCGNEPFLHLVGDHLYLTGRDRGCASELVQLAVQEECTVSAVRATHESQLASFGTVGGQPVHGRPGVYRVDKVLEKPTPTLAEQKLIVPGLRAGHYLAFFGMHVLTPTVLDVLGRLVADQDRPTLSDALAVVAKQETYLALRVSAERYDLGATYGLLQSQLALALAGQGRDEVLSMLVQLLANERANGSEQGRVDGQ